MGIDLPRPFSMSPDGREKIQVQSLTSWSLFKRNQTQEPCAHSIELCADLSTCESCGMIHTCTCDTPARPGVRCVICVHLRATCASLKTLASICAQNKNFQATCGTLADKFWGFLIWLLDLKVVLQRALSLIHVTIGIMWFSTYCFNTCFGPTMEILGSLERYWHVKSIFHKFGA